MKGNPMTKSNTDQNVVETDAGTRGSVQSSLFHRSRLGRVVCLVLFLTVSNRLGGQAINSTLQGRVSDTTGAVIPGATVTALNAGTGLKRSVVVSAEGEYQIGGLPSGDYTVEVEKPRVQLVWREAP